MRTLCKKKSGLYLRCIKCQKKLFLAPQVYPQQLCKRCFNDMMHELSRREYR